MIPPTFGATLADDHRQAMLAEAASHRLAKRARAAQRHGRSSPGVANRIGRMAPASLVRFRPIRRSADLRSFTDVDHHDHEALVATHRFSGRILGVARYVRQRDDRSAAELAVTIDDEWQRRGLGTALVQRLAAHARCAGVRRFTATMAVDNMGARALLSKICGPVSVLERDGTTVTYVVKLALAAETRAPHWLSVLGPATTGCVDG